MRAEKNDIDLKKNSNDWWIHELVLWQDTHNWQNFNQTHLEKKREDSNKQKRKWKIRNNNWYQRNTKDIKKYHEQVYANKLDNLDEMDKFLETNNLPKLNQKESDNLNREITPVLP